MQYQKLRDELRAYYKTASYENAAKNLKKGTEILDKMYKEGMSSYDMKVMQYQTIAVGDIAASAKRTVLFNMRCI